MASLMEELISVLELECTTYEKLLELSKSKAFAISGRDIALLEKITDEEQNVVSDITKYDAKRAEVTADIANVINKDVDSLKLSVLIGMLGKQPNEQRRLSDVHDRLKTVVANVKRVNESNQELIKDSLEMVQFDLNLIRSMRQAPETANYGRSAVSVGGTLGSVSGFDAKQ